MNILITGGCGFIGSNFINKIYNTSFCDLIVNIDAMYYCANIKNINEDIINSDKYVFIHDNICNTEKILETLQKYNITHIVHFAAQSHVQDSFTDSYKYIQDNVVGTHSLLTASQSYGKLTKFIHISTDEVYGESLLDSNENKKNEGSILCPTNPYAATKASAEMLACSYYHSFKVPIIITRGNNVYGPNQYPEKLIPKFISLLKNDEKVPIQGDGTNVRGFLYVTDVADALICVLKNGEIGEIYNIGSDDTHEYTVKDVAKKLIMLIKKSTNFDDYITYIEDRPFNDKRYYISNQKIKDLGWEIKVEFDDGLAQLI